MSYQLQYRALAEEFRKAGLGPESAIRIAQILANASQPRRSGPVEVDTTPAGIRSVSSDRRKFQLTNLDFLDGDPYHRKRRLEASENRQAPTQPSALQTAQSPQATDAPFSISPGSFTEARVQSDGVTVGLKTTGSGAFLTQDAASGSLVGRSLRADADSSDGGFLRFFIEEQGSEYVFRLQTDYARLREFIAETVNGSSAGGGTQGSPFPTPTPAQLALVAASLTADGLCFRRANGEAFCLQTVACEQQ
jgi:hypothetical protein